MMNLLSSSDDEEEREPRRRKTFKIRTNFDMEDPTFREKFRLRRDEVEFILTRIGGMLQHKTNLNKALSPEQQLLVTLHWMGNGSQYHGVSDMHALHKSTVCRVVKRVVMTVVNSLFQEVVRWPEDRSNIAQDFHHLGGFPSVAGCVDGTLIKIDAPTTNEEQFVDRHGNHSINSMMICGPSYELYYVNARWPGSCHDSRVLRNSTISNNFENGWRPFPNAVLLGDSGYAVKDWLMVPIHIQPDSRAEQKYNRCHKKTRRMVECTIGILKERFPCLNQLRVNPNFAGNIVMAAATFHNIARKEDFDWNNFLDIQEPLQENAEAIPTPNERLNQFLAYFQ